MMRTLTSDGTSSGLRTLVVVVRSSSVTLDSGVEGEAAEAGTESPSCFSTASSAGASSATAVPAGVGAAAGATVSTLDSATTSSGRSRTILSAALRYTCARGRSQVSDERACRETASAHAPSRSAA